MYHTHSKDILTAQEICDLTFFSRQISQISYPV